MAVAIHNSTPEMPDIEARHLQQIALTVTDVSQVSEARRRVAERTAALHFSGNNAGAAAIVATELAGNLIKHGGGGELLLRTIGERDNAGIEMLALDNGRGMDVIRCLIDGYSTAASPGTGLGAIQRLSASSDFYSQIDAGSAVLATLWSNATPAAETTKWMVGGINVPLPGEEICGDAWAVRCHDSGIDVMVVDGLGHGPEAAKAAGAAAMTFLARSGRTPSQYLLDADAALQATRGAAMGVAIIDFRRGDVSFAGIGNTVAIVLTRDSVQHLVSFGGIVGQRIHLREFTTPWSDDSMFIGHSDGIGTRWSLSSYPGLAARHPSLIAGVLYRDFARGRDDASVLVIKPRS